MIYPGSFSTAGTLTGRYVAVKSDTGKAALPVRET